MPEENVKTLWGDMVNLDALRSSLKRRITKAREEVPKSPLPVNQLARLTITPTSTPDEWLVKYNGMLQIVNEYTGKVHDMVREYDNVLSELDSFVQKIEGYVDPYKEVNARIDDINERFRIFLDQYKSDMGELFAVVESEVASNEPKGE